ncbi:hypothetical protein OVW23_27555, partial [Klebsiella pneumoniae]|nr:hypothetical protein [Klebsiella pneumoniae]
MKTKGKVSEVVDFQKEWQAEFGQDLPQTAVFVNRDWAKTHAADIARFEQSYQEAVLQVNQQAGETLKIAAEEFG